MQPDPAYVRQQINQEVNHAVSVNAQVAAILTEAKAKLLALDLSVHSFLHGYDLADIPGQLDDMTPVEPNYKDGCDLREIIGERWAA